MHIRIKETNNDKQGEILYSWPERIRILIKGKQIFSQKGTKDFINLFMDMFLKLNLQLDEDIRNTQSQVGKEIKEK